MATRMAAPRKISGKKVDEAAAKVAKDKALAAKKWAMGLAETDGSAVAPHTPYVKHSFPPVNYNPSKEADATWLDNMQSNRVLAPLATALIFFRSLVSGTPIKVQLGIILFNVVSVLVVIAIAASAIFIDISLIGSFRTQAMTSKTLATPRYSGADWCFPVQAFFALPSATRGLTGNEMRARDPDASCPEMTWKLSIEKAQYWYKAKPDLPLKPIDPPRFKEYGWWEAANGTGLLHTSKLPLERFTARVYLKACDQPLDELILVSAILHFLGVPLLLIRIAMGAKRIIEFKADPDTVTPEGQDACELCLEPFALAGLWEIVLVAVMITGWVMFLRSLTCEFVEDGLFINALGVISVVPSGLLFTRAAMTIKKWSESTSAAERRSKAELVMSIVNVGTGTAPIFGLCFTLNHSICSRSDAPYQRIAPCCALLSLFYVGVLAHGLYGHFALAWTPDGGGGFLYDLVVAQVNNSESSWFSKLLYQRIELWIEPLKATLEFIHLELYVFFSDVILVLATLLTIFPVISIYYSLLDRTGEISNLKKLEPTDPGYPGNAPLPWSAVSRCANYDPMSYIEKAPPPFLDLRVRPTLQWGQCFSCRPCHIGDTAPQKHCMDSVPMTRYLLDQQLVLYMLVAHVLLIVMMALARTFARQLVTISIDAEARGEREVQRLAREVVRRFNEVLAAPGMLSAEEVFDRARDAEGPYWDPNEETAYYRRLFATAGGASTGDATANWRIRLPRMRQFAEFTSYWTLQSVDEAREVAFNRYVCRCIDEEKFRRLMKSNPKMAKRQMPTVNDRLEFRPRLSKEQEKLAKKEAKAKKNLEERVD